MYYLDLVMTDWLTCPFVEPPRPMDPVASSQSSSVLPIFRVLSIPHINLINSPVSLNWSGFLVDIQKGYPLEGGSYHDGLSRGQHESYEAVCCSRWAGKIGRSKASFTLLPKPHWVIFKRSIRPRAIIRQRSCTHRQRPGQLGLSSAEERPEVANAFGEAKAWA